MYEREAKTSRYSDELSPSNEESGMDVYNSSSNQPDDIKVCNY